MKELRLRMSKVRGGWEYTWVDSYGCVRMEGWIKGSRKTVEAHAHEHYLSMRMS